MLSPFVRLPYGKPSFIGAAFLILTLLLPPLIEVDMLPLWRSILYEQSLSARSFWLLIEL